MNKYVWTIIILIVVIIGIIIFKKCSNAEKVVPPTKIEELQTKIDSIYIVKDSILQQIDTVYIKLEKTNKQYEKDVNRILSYDVDEDLRFFLEYIESNKSRLDSISSSIIY